VTRDTIAVLAVLTALFGGLWPTIQAKRQRGRFKRLMRRELQELKPKDEPWDKPKPDYVHRAVIEDPQAHLDFVLSLDPRLVYDLRRLWWAFGRNEGEFLDRLWTIAEYTGKPIKSNVENWRVQIAPCHTFRPHAGFRWSRFLRRSVGRYPRGRQGYARLFRAWGRAGGGIRNE
jgi:hypothetical protein